MLVNKLGRVLAAFALIAEPLVGSLGAEHAPAPQPRAGAQVQVEKQVRNWGAQALRMARLQAGTPFALGCEPYAGIDCSCLVQWSFSRLPGFGSFERESRSQEARLSALADDGRRTKVDAVRVDVADVRRGDLIFSDYDQNPGADHVAFHWSDGYVYDAQGPGSVAGRHARELSPRDVVAVYRVIGVTWASQPRG